MSSYSCVFMYKRQGASSHLFFVNLEQPPPPPCCYAQRASTQENQEEKCKLGVMGAHHVAVPVRCGCLCGLYTPVYFLQFAPVVGNFAAEKQKNLGKKSVQDVKKATNALIAAEERQVAVE